MDISPWDIHTFGVLSLECPVSFQQLDVRLNYVTANMEILILSIQSKGNGSYTKFPIIKNEITRALNIKSPHMSWIGGILELSSPLRYGITTRGVPIYRFVPYDRTIGPFAVGCSHRDLLRNVHAIVSESSRTEGPSKEIPRATLVQLLGVPTAETETNILLSAYAYDSKKELRKHPDVETIIPKPLQRQRIEGFTFQFYSRFSGLLSARVVQLDVGASLNFADLVPFGFAMANMGKLKFLGALIAVKGQVVDFMFV